jgi:hypothetical protein
MTATAKQALLIDQLRQLEGTKRVLLDRLERLLTALTLTLDAEAAFEERLWSMSGDHSGHKRAARRHESSADRYRRLLAQLRELNPPPG